MRTSRVLLPDNMSWNFLVTLIAKLISIRPKILTISSVKITATGVKKGKYFYNFKAVVKEQQKAPGQRLVEVGPTDPAQPHLRACMYLPDGLRDFEMTLHHRDDCPWDIVDN